MQNTLINKSAEIIVIIPAAGIGKRMQVNFPKQYIKIMGKTIIEHTISIFLKNPRISKILVSLNKNDNIFYQLKIQNNSTVQTVIGGFCRAYSVLFALNYLINNLNLNPNSWVLIHDAVRPCLPQSDLNNIIQFIDSRKFLCGGLLAIPIQDTIKCAFFKNKVSVNYTIDRNMLWRALTPQFFPLGLIRNCLIHTLSKKLLITDDSSALEYCGYYPELLKGDIKNLKITYPEDLFFVEFYFSRIINEKRIL